jgi:DNA-binding CsgD family transcriptional regulator
MPKAGRLRQPQPDHNPHEHSMSPQQFIGGGPAMTATATAVQLHASHASFRPLVEGILTRAGIPASSGFRHGVAKVVLDFPLTWAFQQLEPLNSFERSHTLVCTQASHQAYLDCLASYHLSAVVNCTDENSFLSGVYAAASAQRIYQYASGLTYMELRVTRLLLIGRDTRAIALQLRISHKTVNAHVSNILCKLGYESRAQYVAVLMGSQVPVEDE